MRGGAKEILLTITGKDVKGNIAVCLSQDIDNLGALSVNGKEQECVLTSRIACTIKNYVWDGNFKWLIAIYTSVALLIIGFVRNEEDSKNNRLLFATSIILSILGMYILVPYLFRCPQIAENVLNFYYLTSKYSVWNCLFMSDAGYLPLGQRLIAIIFIKVLGLGVDSLYYMQATGIILDAIMAATICLYTFRNLGTRTTRFAVSLLVTALFANSLVSTFFDFIYMGYFFILLCIMGNIKELKKWQFIIICTASIIICLSKGLYSVFFPFGIIVLLLCRDILILREKIYILCLTLSSGTQLLYAFLHGGISKWIDIEIKNAVILGILICICFFTLLICSVAIVPKVREWLNHSLLLQNMVKPGMILILMTGSFLLTFFIYHSITTIAFILNWGCAWYVPFSMGLIVLMCYVSNNVTIKFYKYVSYIVLVCYGVISLRYSSDKCYVNYNCADWSVYKGHFAETVVPVFTYNTRFGTMADDLILCYSGRRPEDNYEYRAPYRFENITIEESDNNMVSEFALPAQILDRFTGAIYLNYPGNVGNGEIYLECLDCEGNLIGEIFQVSPISSKTIGFIPNEEMQGIAAINVKSKESGKEAFVENDIILIQK